jgi:hypothetical protein
MASQQSDAFSALGSEQFSDSEAPNSSKPTPSTSSVTFNSKKRPRTSKIWDYTPGAHNDSFTNSAGKAVWRCKFCRKEYLETTGSKAVMLHLQSAHSITIQSTQVIKTLSRQASIAEAFQHTNDHKRRNLTTEDIGSLDGALLEVLYIRWITTCGIAFRMVEIEEFRALLLYLNPAIDNYLPSSHTTIQLWTIRTYTAEKVRIQQKVQSALSKIHFTVDLWSSPNSLAIIGMIGHYISDTGNLQHSVLALKELDGAHSGQNQAESIMEVINDYGIASKVGYFVMDNASNNDTMIKALSHCMYLNTLYYIVNNIIST